jgi:hypothetical protein
LIFPSPLISHLASTVQYAGEKTERPIVHAHSHAYFDCACKLLERAVRAKTASGLSSSLSAPGILGRIRVQSIHHASIFRNKADGSERQSGTGVERRSRAESDTWSCQVGSGEGSRTEAPCAGRLCCLALSPRWLETCRSPDVSDALPTCTAAHEAAGGLIDGGKGIGDCYSGTRSVRC